MNNALKIFEESYNIRFYDADLNGKLSIRSIFKYIQEIAINHAEKLGFGIEFITRNAKGWVLSNLSVKIHSIPNHRQTVRIKTYIPNAGKLKAYRNFVMSDENDNVLCEAKSIWYLIDINTKKPVLINAIMKDFLTENLDGIMKNNKIPTKDNYTYHKDFHIRSSDIDMNKHVNNTSYIEWIIETIPYDTLSSNQLKELDITFREESFYGDMIPSYCEKLSENPEFIHELISKNENKTVCIARTKFF